jgi:multimeric flavodoxin WrbA
MNVVGFVGSPREGGNTEILVNEVLSGAAEKGAETKVFNLNVLEIKGCQACRHCKSHEGCIIKDDMQTLYDEIIRADAIVLGSPIYMWQMTAQTKLFIDRLYALLDSNLSPRYDDKNMVLVFAQGAEDPNMFKSYIEHTANLFNHGKLQVRDIVVAAGVGAKGDVKQRENVMTQAKNIGQELVKST